jgi:N-acetylneuraminic acid mutarotase
MFLALSTVGVAQEAWSPTSTTNAREGRYSHGAVWTGSRMIVWGGFRSGFGYLDTGGIYDPNTDTWVPTSLRSAPTARRCTAVWTGSKMIVWGGWAEGYGPVNTGAVYDPATDSWTPTSTINAPGHRSDHTAVWTGSRMIVWGGGSLSTGGVYDPATDSWSATSTINAPSPRSYHAAVWTGSRMIVWGGGGLNDGGIYDPATDTWTATSTTNAPSGRNDHTAVWTGSRLILWGGTGGAGALYLNTGGIYDPATDTWTATSTMDAPASRQRHGALWTGSQMIVWGGYGVFRSLATGGLYSNPTVVPPLPPPADFYTLTPCRLVDTRQATGPSGGPALSPGATRGFPVAGACGIPSTATAVSVNLTAVQPTAQGNLSLSPGDAAGPPLTSTINFSPGVTRSNFAVVRLAQIGGAIDVTNRSAGPVHFVLDVTGYFQ